MSTLVTLVALLSSLVVPGAERPQTAEVRAVDDAIAEWDNDRAETLVERLLGRHPEASETHLLAARVHFMAGRYDQALAALRRADELANDDEARLHAREFTEFVEPLAALDATFSVEESEHFRVHFVDGPDRVLVRRALLVLEASYEVMGEEYGIRPTSKVRVEIFPDAESFQKASTLTRKEIETSGTIALCKFNRIMMMSPRLVLRGFGWCDTLCHEYVHYVLWRRNGPTIPIWLHEGLAKYQEPRWTGGAGSALTPRMQRVLKGAVDADQFVTFEQMHPSFAKLDDPRQVELASAEVLSVVRTVLARGGSELMGRMLDALREGHEWPQMFEVALDEPFEAFWSAWKADVGRELAAVKGAPPPAKRVQLRDPMVPPPGFDGDGPTEEAAAEKPDEPVAKEADADDEDEEAEESRGRGRWVRLGDMLYERQMFRAAAIEYEKAIDQDEPSHILLNRAARTHQRAGDLDLAVSRYLRSLELEPEYAPTLTHLGLLYVSLRDAAAAVEMLERAAAINPYDPRIHEALADTYGGLGRGSERKGALDDLAALRRTSSLVTRDPNPTKEP